MQVCPYCTNSDSTPLYPTTDIFGDHWIIHNCHSCSARFICPTPTPEQLVNAYSKHYYGSGKTKFSSGIEKLLDQFRKNRASRLNRHLKQSGKVLDIGCGNGRFLFFIQQLGHEIYGIEMPGGSAERAQQITGLNLKVGKLENDDYSPNSFDAITMYNVFEHLSEPKKYLNIISQIIKPGGYVVMSFPNIDSIQSSLFRGNWFHLDPPRHLFFFTPKDFRREMTTYGLTSVREKHFSLEYNPYGWQQSILNTVFKQRDVLFEHMKSNTKTTRNYSPLNLLLQGLLVKATTPLFIGLDLFESALRKGGTVEFILKKHL